MPQYVLNRNYCLVTLSGRSYEFRKGVPVLIPFDAVRAAVAIGATPADGSDPEVTDPEALPTAPRDPHVRAEAINDVIEKLVSRGDRGDFSAAGIPTPKVVSQLLGWNADLREISNVFKAYNINKAEVAAQAAMDAKVE